jgi:hypothetical protein
MTFPTWGDEREGEDMPPKKILQDSYIYQMPYDALSDRDKWAVVTAGLWLVSQDEMARLVEIDAQRRAKDMARGEAKRVRARARYEALMRVE